MFWLPALSFWGVYSFISVSDWLGNSQGFLAFDDLPRVCCHSWFTSLPINLMKPWQERNWRKKENNESKRIKKSANLGDLSLHPRMQITANLKVYIWDSRLPFSKFLWLVILGGDEKSRILAISGG